MLELQTDFYCLEIYHDKILFVRYKDKSKINKEIALQLIEDIKKVVGERSYFSIVDLRDVFGVMTPEAKAIAANHPFYNKYREAEAILVNSFPMKMLVKLYLNKESPSSPSNSFTKLDAALKWFTTFDENLELV